MRAVLDATLGISALSYDKLPEVVLYQRTLDRVYLIELATSHGPVSPDRQAELEELFRSSSVKRVYVTAFPDFATFTGCLTDIALETEVWLAEIPGHMIHLCSSPFPGPRP